MRTIWPYDLGSNPISKHNMPAGAEFRHAGIDGEGRLSVWMDVDDEFENTELVTFGTFNTQNTIPNDWTYRASVQVGSFCLHIHEYNKRDHVVAPETDDAN